MADHAGNQLVVDGVGEQLGITLHQVFEYLQVGLALREAATILDSHGLADDEFGDFGVGTIHTLVVNIERVALGAFYDLDFRARSGCQEGCCEGS